MSKRRQLKTQERNWA